MFVCLSVSVCLLQRQLVYIHCLFQRHVDSLSDWQADEDQNLYVDRQVAPTEHAAQTTALCTSWIIRLQQHRATYHWLCFLLVKLHMHSCLARAAAIAGPVCGNSWQVLFGQHMFVRKITRLVAPHSLCEARPGPVIFVRLSQDDDKCYCQLCPAQDLSLPSCHVKSCQHCRWMRTLRLIVICVKWILCNMYKSLCASFSDCLPIFKSGRRIDLIHFLAGWH